MSFVEYVALCAFACSSSLPLTCAKQCERAIGELPALFYELLAVLHCQLEQAPSDFFEDDVTASNFLVSMLSRLFDNIATVYEQRVSGLTDDAIPEQWSKLVRRSRRFRSTLEERYERDFGVDDADDDDEPVVVELD